MKTSKLTCQFVAIGLISMSASSAAHAQLKSSNKKDAVYSTIGINPTIKDEKGNMLTNQQMIARTKTGDYKVSRKLDSDKKPYLLVEKVPGFERRPEYIPVIVKPIKKP